MTTTTHQGSIHIVVVEIRGGKATNIRVYVADEDGGDVLMGARAS